MKKKPKARLFIISGISGAGKSQALKTFEDLGFFCIDNLPVKLLPDFVDLLEGSKKMERVAMGMDIRGADFLQGFSDSLRLLKEKNVPYRILFLDAADSVLVRRFSETRHKHPLGQNIAEAIAEERRRLVEVKALADKVIDTSNMTLGELKETLSKTLELTQSKEMILSVTSFGYKYGLPMDADVVMDVRFMPNPNYEPGLKKLTGLDAGVRRFLIKKGDAQSFLNSYFKLLKTLLPRYVREGKSYLTLAIGCTGGHHRSVFVAHELARYLQGQGYPVREFHRDITK